VTTDLTIPERANRLDDIGRTYLLGWLVGAIRDEGQATTATLDAAVPLAEQWQANWTGPRVGL
jgi:hypothetical protein